MNAFHIQKSLKNVDHVIYEKNEDIGGTWLENRYPGKYTRYSDGVQRNWLIMFSGAACDIPSHAYTYPFALNVCPSTLWRRNIATDCSYSLIGPSFSPTRESYRFFSLL